MLLKGFFWKLGAEQMEGREGVVGKSGSRQNQLGVYCDALAKTEVTAAKVMRSVSEPKRRLKEDTKVFWTCC